MKATIIRADEVKVGDRITYRECVADVIVAKSADDGNFIKFIVRAEYGDRDISYWSYDLVARIDPEPVEEREYWTLKTESKSSGLIMTSVFKDTDNPEFKSRLDNSVKATLSHVRETVLSREEMNDEEDNAE